MKKQGEVEVGQAWPELWHCGITGNATFLLPCVTRLLFPNGNWISGFLLALRIKSKLFPCMASMALSYLSLLRSNHTGLSAPLTPRPCLASAIFPMLSPLLKSAFHPLSLAGSFSPAKFQLYMSLSKMASDHPIYQRMVPCWFSNSDLIFCIVLPATFMCCVSRAGVSKHFS